METLLEFLINIVGDLIIPALVKQYTHRNTSYEQTIDRSGSSEQNGEYDET